VSKDGVRLLDGGVKKVPSSSVSRKSLEELIRGMAESDVKWRHTLRLRIHFQGFLIGREIDPA
jgi:hypothetical protein